MLLDTHITMPNQDPMAGQEFSLASRNVRKWLKALPYIDQNVAAQQFYDGLRRSNRQAHPTKQRLAAIEHMRPVARDFLKEQRKFLIAQPFPLPKKATEILKLQQNILSELAVAYKIIIQEVANRDTQLSPIKLIACIHQAMRYMLEQYITLAQVYSEPPQGYWQDYCQLYKMAEHIKLSHFPIKNETHINSSKLSTNCLFKQACLLSLANLHGYGHGDADKIASYLEAMNHLTTLSEKKHTQDNNCAYFINLTINKPPRLVAADEFPISSENRFLDPKALIAELREMIASTNDAATGSILSTFSLNRSLAKRLLDKLTTKPKRIANRAVPSKENLSLVLGFRDAVNTLLQTETEADAHEKHKLTNTYLDLLPLDRHQIASSHNVHSIFNHNALADYSSNAWDCIGRGNIFTGSYSATTPKVTENKNSSAKISSVIQSWKISNASNGGYCLKSDNTSDYQSQVGDLVLLRREDHSSKEWHLGVVRWMQSLSGQGVKIGIETLNGFAQPIEVIDAQLSLNKFKGLEHILQFTEETAQGKIITLIAPPNSISSGESLDVQMDGEKQTIVFQQAVERTISFVRFSFSKQPSSPS